MLVCLFHYQANGLVQIHDISARVRATLFELLGRMVGVTEPLLLQAFDKKSVGQGPPSFQGRAAPAPRRVRARLVQEDAPLTATGPCGAFIHGYEDDDYGTGVSRERGRECVYVYGGLIFLRFCVSLARKIPWHVPCPCCCPCLALPCPALPCPALPCPALPCPALPCPALPCPALPRHTSMPCALPAL